MDHDLIAQLVHQYIFKSMDKSMSRSINENEINQSNNRATDFGHTYRIPVSLQICSHGFLVLQRSVTSPSPPTSDPVPPSPPATPPPPAIPPPSAPLVSPPSSLPTSAPCRLDAMRSTLLHDRRSGARRYPKWQEHS